MSIPSSSCASPDANFTPLLPFDAELQLEIPSNESDIPDATFFDGNMTFSDVLQAKNFVYPFTPDLRDVQLPIFLPTSSIAPAAEDPLAPSVPVIAAPQPPSADNWELDLLAVRPQDVDVDELSSWLQLASDTGFFADLPLPSSTGSLATSLLPAAAEALPEEGLQIADSGTLFEDLSFLDMLGPAELNMLAQGPYPFAPDLGSAVLPQFPSGAGIEPALLALAAPQDTLPPSPSSSASASVPPPGLSSHGMTRAEAKARCAGLIQKTFTKKDRTQYKAWPCPMANCKRKYSKHSSVIRHMAEVRGICPVCKKTFTRGTDDYLNRHLRGGPAGCKGPPTVSSAEDGNDEGQDDSNVDDEDDDD